MDQRNRFEQLTDKLLGREPQVYDLNDLVLAFQSLRGRLNELVRAELNGSDGSLSASLLEEILPINFTAYDNLMWEMSNQAMTKLTNKQMQRINDYLVKQPNQGYPNVYHIFGRMSNIYGSEADRSVYKKNWADTLSSGCYHMHAVFNFGDRMYSQSLVLHLLQLALCANLMEPDHLKSWVGMDTAMTDGEIEAIDSTVRLVKKFEACLDIMASVYDPFEHDPYRPASALEAAHA
jgi:hypothetical protein